MKIFARFSRLSMIYVLGSYFFSHGLFAQAPGPLIKLQFNESSGTVVSNTGTAAAVVTRSSPTPSISTNVPAGVGGTNAIDFGTAQGNYFVQSSGIINALKNLSAFTLTGWINTRSATAGSGGNRIISWINNGGEGVDLVYQSNGSLRLGVDGWPDFSPAFSSPNKVTVNATAPATNWVFFAVTYQSNGQVQFYFGNNTTNAALDVTRSYPGPGITGGNIAKLAIGAFNDMTRGTPTYDRMFRGLIDNVQIHGSALNIQNIIAVQRGVAPPDTTPPPAPTSLTVQSVTSSSVTLHWQVPQDRSDISSYVVTGSNGLGGQLIAVVTLTPLIFPDLSPNTTYTFFVQSKDQAGNLSTPSNTVTVKTLATPDTTPPSTPSNLVATGKTFTTINLGWTPSTDNVGVTQYRVYNGVDIIATVQSPMAILENLIPGHTYGLSVTALDAAGNESTNSNHLQVTTNPTSGVILDPLVSLEFNETSGLTVNHTGTAATGSFTRSANFPASSTLAPAGSSISFDFGTTPGNYYVQSGAPIDALKNLNAFTLTGWLNCKSNVAGPGGNRILSWIKNGGEGVDLVYQSDGSLRLGVDGWPDFSPALSSPNKVLTNASAPASNWVFFAVTYQSNGQVQFYFGNNTTDAALDVTKSYSGPGATGADIGKLAIGAFNDATRVNSNTYNRMFRGLIDRVAIYGAAMSLSEIVAIQRNLPADRIAPTTPQDFKVYSKTTTSVSLQWNRSTDNVGVTGYNLYYRTGGPTIPPKVISIIGDNNTSYTLTGLTPGTLYDFEVSAKDAANNISRGTGLFATTYATLFDPLVDIRFEQLLLPFEPNLGTLGMEFYGAGSRGSKTPVSGGNYSANSVMTTAAPLEGLRNLKKFTIVGWINKATTSGQNRIVGWQPVDGGEGVELMVSSDGTLGLGVNERPENGVFSTANKISIDPDASAANWVFFAVTYDDAGQAKFYFGNNVVNATLDVERNYSMGPAGPNDIGKMYINPEGAVLLDEIRVFGSVLSLDSIITLQGTMGAPSGLKVTSVSSTSIGLHWTAPTSAFDAGIPGYEIFNGSTLLAVYPTEYHDNLNTTLTGLTPGTSYTLTVKAKDGKGNYSLPTNAVVVATSQSFPIMPVIWLKLDDKVVDAFANSGTAPAYFYTGFANKLYSPSLVHEAPDNVGWVSAARLGGFLSVNSYIETSEPINELKNLNAFTLTGWVNNESNVTGSGGNRIISWINRGGDGVDLVYQNNGSLRLGVDGWPDNSPAFSSPNKVTTDASRSPSNWIFFAVTYQSNGQVEFYFGNNASDATLDVTRMYNAGPTGSAIGKMAVGTFNDASRNASTIDRTFRGLIDNIQVYNVALTAEQIVRIQRVNPEDIDPLSSSNARIAAPLDTKDIQGAIEEGETPFEQNYPNPFTTSTQIDLYVPSSVNTAQVIVKDINGRASKHIDVQGRGKTSVTIESTNMSSGIYFYSLVIDGKVVGTKRMAVLR